MERRKRPHRRLSRLEESAPQSRPREPACSAGCPQVHFPELATSDRPRRRLARPGCVNAVGHGPPAAIANPVRERARSCEGPNLDSLELELPAQFAHEFQRLRIVAVNAERFDLSFAQKPERLLHSFLWRFDKRVGFGAWYERAIGSITAIGKAFGHESAPTWTKRLRSRTGQAEKRQRE